MRIQPWWSFCLIMMNGCFITQEVSVLSSRPMIRENSDLIFPDRKRFPWRPIPITKVRNNAMILYDIQWNSVNSTSVNTKTYLTQSKFHGPWSLLGISRSFSHNSNWSPRLVPSNHFFCDWMCLHFYGTSLISLFSFHMRWNLLHSRRFSQEIEYTRVKWTCYGGHTKQRESITHNSNFS